MTSRRQLHRAPLLDAAAGTAPTRQPVWFMRQAGRSLPEYRAIREGVGMLESCFRPDLLAEITLQPVRRHDVDAAILFSDIVVPLKAAGVDVDIVAGRGPVVAQPIRGRGDVDKLPRLDQDIPAIREGIATILEELTDTQALIGFAGAPFTLASYLVEGGPSKTHQNTKALMHNDPDTWNALMESLVETVLAFIRIQLDAGVDAWQLFDSWAGYLSEYDYRTFVEPHSRHIFAELESAGVPRIHFGVGTGELLGDMAAAGPDVVGVDWRVPLDRAAARICAAAEPKVLQGNLDPAILFAGEATVRAEVARIKADAARAIAAGQATGHIFNLGHGVLPDTPAEAITKAVEIIHEP
ncbi:uroporphyrinogen decarboxylase [Corynebacterium uberis]|uniref:uroporphyrinogen decarboxylase n=1 Tax=Corynebacterium TaxID=1716 RepID=UPI001D0A9349|nr:MULTISPECIES: uroporphyrinogen decarboxylase [Corynebacterium]MCZ9309513.1 uroporphyrinogen decarboxylase [Corynebacterium sp. c6VSa_13]UDL73060.1 uroporphyrinogen decarboxylase [Corynebacterium uberis]UDL76063.1 uroporphyrinogen decarboxylase [Corynebacterium uberis]UDL78275.1 uroporphyrinogen decarboxylase [Corynebacterium uberis]UDL80558.1 uroporphyrinogen decarboxylase [Corynebacterium uberis]